MIKLKRLRKKGKMVFSLRSGYLDYDFLEDIDQLKLLLEQLERDFELLDIGKKVIIDEKQRKLIAGEVIKSIRFAKENGIPLNEEQYQELIGIEKVLNELYKRIDPEEIKIEEQITRYNDIANEIWQDYLKESSNMIIHIGLIDGDYDKKIMSTSLITDREVGNFSYNGEGIRDENYSKENYCSRI